MKRLIIVVLVLFLGACSKSPSYEEGRAMADKTYGAMAPQQMAKQAKQIMQQIQGELQKSEDKRDWWNGFCDRGEEIWLERMDAMNEAMGQEVFNTSQVENMFDQMRASFRE